MLSDTKVVVSIIIPCYNCENTIKRCIDSVTNQSFRNYEIIIIDDCSQDNTLSLLDGLASHDNRIKILSNESNLGAAASRNRAIEIACGEYLSFLDSDDYWYAGKLDRDMRIIEKYGYEFICSQYDIVDADNLFIRSRKSNRQKLLLNDLFKNNVVGCSTVTIKRSVVLDAGGFPENSKREDFELWIKILEKRQSFVYFIPESSVAYTLDSSSSSGNKLKMASANFSIYFRSRGVFGVYLFFFYAYNNLRIRLFP